MSKMIKLYNTLRMLAFGNDCEIEIDTNDSCGYESKQYENNLYDALEADDTDLAPYADSYHGDTYYEKLISTKITCERIKDILFGVAECEVSDDWTDDDTKQLKKYLSGQYSDGWGEGFEQHEIASYEEEDEFLDEDTEEYYYDTVTYNVYVSFWQYRNFRIMTEDELKEYIGK